MCGLAGSGKSTYARELVTGGFVRFSIDEEAWGLGFTAAVAVPPEVADAIRARQRTAIVRALESGADVVVDYAFPTRAERDDYRALARAQGATVAVVHLATPEHVARARLGDRRGVAADDMVVDPDLFDRFAASFEPPSPDDADVTIVVPEA